MHNFTLLYVEDNIDTQEHIKFLLSDRCKEFYQAYDGKEGLELYKEKRPDIIISDINLPELNGLDMSEEIKKIDSAIPIIIISAFDSTKTLLKAINIGIDYFVTKPIDIDLIDKKLSIITQNLQNKIDLENMKKRELDELYNLAHYDLLTEIPNRFLFDVKFDQAISRAKRENGVFTLFFIDLDNFKSINDTYGHDGGDKILQKIARCVKEIIRVEDTFARISGDEFSLIVENIDDKNYIDILAKKILKATDTSIIHYGDEIKITCSIGISRYPKDSDSKQELKYLADQSMYEAKKMGKATYSFHN